MLSAVFLLLPVSPDGVGIPGGRSAACEAFRVGECHVGSSGPICLSQWCSFWCSCCRVVNCIEKYRRLTLKIFKVRNKADFHWVECLPAFLPSFWPHYPKFWCPLILVHQKYATCNPKLFRAGVGPMPSWNVCLISRANRLLMSTVEIIPTNVHQKCAEELSEGGFWKGTPRWWNNIPEKGPTDKLLMCIFEASFYVEVYEREYNKLKHEPSLSLQNPVPPLPHLRTSSFIWGPSSFVVWPKPRICMGKWLRRNFLYLQ